MYHGIGDNDDLECLDECPTSHYAAENTCQPCHQSCFDYGYDSCSRSYHLFSFQMHGTERSVRRWRMCAMSICASFGRYVSCGSCSCLCSLSIIIIVTDSMSTARVRHHAGVHRRRSHSLLSGSTEAELLRRTICKCVSIWNNIIVFANCRFASNVKTNAVNAPDTAPKSIIMHAFVQNSNSHQRRIVIQTCVSMNVRGLCRLTTNDYQQLFVSAIAIIIRLINACDAMICATNMTAVRDRHRPTVNAANLRASNRTIVSTIMSNWWVEIVLNRSVSCLV